MFDLPHLGKTNLKPLIYKQTSKLMLKGEKSFLQENYSSALNAFKKSLLTEGDCIEVRNNIAACILMLSDEHKAYKILKSLKATSQIAAFNLALSCAFIGFSEKGLETLKPLPETEEVLILKAVLHHQLSDPISCFRCVNKLKGTKETQEINSILKSASPQDTMLLFSRGREKYQKAVRMHLYNFFSKSNKTLPLIPIASNTSEDEIVVHPASIFKRKMSKGKFSNTMIIKNNQHILKRIIDPPKNRVKACSPFGGPGFNCKDVLLNSKLTEFSEHHPPKTPVLRQLDLEVDIEIDAFQQLASQSLSYISTEFNKHGKNIEGLYLLLRNLKFFKKHKPEVVKELIKVGIYEKHPAKTVILREGELGIYIFIIISGGVAVSNAANGENIVIASAYDGDIIGEYSFIRRVVDHKPALRSATCTTTEETHLIKILNKDVTEIIEEFADLENDYLVFIKEIPPFNSFTPVDLALLSNTMTSKQFEMNSCILRAGEYPESLFFVYRGRVKIKYPVKRMLYSKMMKTVKHSTITKELTFGSGKFFGQRVLFGKKVPVNFPIYADSLGYTTLLFIYKEDFEQLFRPIQQQILVSLAKAPEFDIKVPEEFTYL